MTSEQPADPATDTDPTAATNDADPVTEADPTAAAGNRQRWITWGIAGGLALVLGLVGGWAGSHLGPSTSAGACDATAIADRVLPTIVTINVSGSGNGVGTGEIIRKDGYIITNDHVIAAAVPSGRVMVTFSNGYTHASTLVGRDITSDIAVLKIDQKDLPVINVADSDAVSVGQPVVALGAPLGLSSTVTAGIVSALGRTSRLPSVGDKPAVIIGGIQTDAAINPGNSGGALVDCQGRMIGVNTAIATVPNADGTAGGGSVGIGFAVPSNRAMSIANDLIEHGSVQHPDFGIQATPVALSAAAAWGTPAGLYVQSVVPRGAADRAGLRQGDIITRINNDAVARADALNMFALSARTGDTVHITYVRDGEQKTLTVTL
ncbi:MAG: trypsin-like peptidase domain-containing protein [Actinobacteria bacterium]|nr:trypsin-like peptidase domain-containing protein [Actinomycetota bacterium]